MPIREHIITNAPKIYGHSPGSGTYDDLGVPSPQIYPQRRPSFITFQDIKIVVGPYQRGIVIAPVSPGGDGTYTLGITAPTVAPTLASAGGGTLTGNMIGYFSWVHKDDGVDIHESDLSPGSNTLTLTGVEQRLWTWSDTPAEARVTHARLYVSVDGELPKFVADVARAVETLTEDTATDALGDTPPVDADGNLTNARGVPPYAQFVEKFRNRAFYGPDPELAYRFWYSEIGEPESVGPLNYFDLLDREPLTCFRKAGDDLACMGAHVLYQHTGYDDSDFRMHKVSDSVGCLSFFSCIAINEILWFPAQLGVYNYIPGGALRYMLGDDLRAWWAAEYKAYPLLFENSIAINDKEESIYKLLLVYPTLPHSRYLVGHYTDIDPANGGQGPMRWTFDYRGRGDSTIGVLFDVGTLREAVYAGSCDGFLRRENDYENDDDDGDSYGKLLTLETAHFFPKDGRGTTVDGALFHGLDVYVQSEEKPWRLEARLGEDNAWQALNPSYARDVRASASRVAGRNRVQQTGHHFNIHRSGKGLIIKITQERARGFSYNGIGFQWAPGLGARPLR